MGSQFGAWLYRRSGSLIGSPIGRPVLVLESAAPVADEFEPGLALPGVQAGPGAGGFWRADEPAVVQEIQHAGIA